jgi:hypothetical protein
MNWRKSYPLCHLLSRKPVGKLHELRIVPLWRDSLQLPPSRVEFREIFLCGGEVGVELAGLRGVVR